MPKQLRRDGRISKNSASGYWSTFRGLLKILYRNRLIKTNINDFLDKIETEDTPKEYLSVEELYKLAETPCKKPILKTDIIVLMSDQFSESAIYYRYNGMKSLTLQPEENVSTQLPKRPRRKTSFLSVTKPCN